MAWTYEDGHIFDDGEDLAIAYDVSATNARLLLQFPDMERVCRQVTNSFGSEGCPPGCDCFVCLSRAIVREIDAAREGGESSAGTS